MTGPDTLSDDYRAGYICGRMETLAVLRLEFKGSSVAMRLLREAINANEWDQYVSRSQP